MRQGEDSRSKLLAAALELFGKTGYDGTSIREICDLAGVNVSMISYYFKSKENLLYAAVEDTIAATTEDSVKFLTASDSRDEFREGLVRFCESVLAFQHQSKDLHRILFNEVHRFPRIQAMLRAGLLQVKTPLMEFLLEGQRRGYVSAEIDVETKVLLVLSVLIGPGAEIARLMKFEFDNTKSDSRHAYCERIVRVFDHGFMA